MVENFVGYLGAFLGELSNILWDFMIRGISKFIEKNQVLAVQVDMESEVTDSKSGVKVWDQVR